MKMADRRKGRKKQGVEEEEIKLDKQQKSVLHWLRKNVAVKKTKFMHSHVVEYFTASKAIDALVNDSPWSKGKAKEGSALILETRRQAMDILHVLLRKNMFHRARKIPVAEKEKKKKKEEEVKEKEEEEEDKGTLRNRKEKKGEKKVEREKKKRKIRLEMHNDQIMVDDSDAYVWLYDPTPWYYYLAGAAIVLGIIGVCLFPLWPTEMRQGVYYLSVAAAGFLVFIIVLAIIKYIIFLVLFILTGTKLKFWIFPNLTEDVGFFESFVPAYVYTYDKPEKKDSDDEESEEEESEDEDSKKGNEVAADGDAEGSEKDDQQVLEQEDGGRTEQGSDSGGSSKEFEIINKDSS